MDEREGVREPFDRGWELEWEGRRMEDAGDASRDGGRVFEAPVGERSVSLQALECVDVSWSAEEEDGPSGFSC